MTSIVRHCTQYSNRTFRITENHHDCIHGNATTPTDRYRPLIIGLRGVFMAHRIDKFISNDTLLFAGSFGSSLSGVWKWKT